jgi:ribosomal protein L11 methyltransferase
MTSSYVEVEIRANEELVDQLVGILSQIGFEGFWEDGAQLKCYINRNRWSTAMAEEVQTTISRMARSSNTTQPIVSVHLIDDRNWNEEWEKTIKPIQVTERIVIKPTWHQYDGRPGEIVLTIDPKMSFGTGYHESTRLVLRLIEKHIRPGTSILDVGTGTGVLAIAGIKLGAASGVGVDVDEWSYDNALENIKLNDADHLVRVFKGDLASVPTEQFGMIVANIQLNVIKPMLIEMKDRLILGGTLIVSGLLFQDRDDILEALSAAGFHVIEELRENEWLAIAAHN